MSNHDDFVTFEKALRELNLRSEELKKLVSEGEIRAFRDGESMKFKREDLDSLAAEADGEEELAFADALEDDTGMVTEELSDEDTLLADDDIEEEATAVAATAVSRRSSSPRAARTVADDGPAKEPGWVIAAAVLGFLVTLWGVFVIQSTVHETPLEESFFTKPWAEKK